MRLRLKTNLSKGFSVPAETIKSVLQASSFLVEKEYVKQTPVNTGDLRQSVKVEKGADGYSVFTDVESDEGEPYAEFLHEGTGSLKGAPDYGFTTGRVRSGDVATGIGGIRPNKFADRAIDQSLSNVVDFIEDKLVKELKK